MHCVRQRYCTAKFKNVMTRIEQIRKEAEDIQSMLECLNDMADINAMLGRLDQLGVYYVRSKELLTEVGAMRDAAMA